MIGALLKGIEQLSDRRTRGVLWMSLGLAVVIFAMIWTVVGYLITQTTFFEKIYLERAVDVLGGIATLVLTVLLFPGIISAFVGLFLDRVADAVEARHYPSLPPADGLNFTDGLIQGLKFVGAIIILNLLMLPFLFTGPLFLVVYYAVNGYLLSREYFELVAWRRMPPADARRLRKSHSGQLILTGVAIAFLLTIPFVNLVAPVVGTAAMVHLFEKWRTRAVPA